MTPSTPHLVRRLAALAAALALLTGCQAISNSTPRSQLRIIDVSPDAPSLDLYQGSTALAYNLSFGTLTSYIAFDPGTYTIAADTAGTRQLLASSKYTFAASAQYTVLIGNPLSSLQQIILTDQTQPAPPGQLALRFVHQGTRSGPLDLYLVPAGQKFTTVTPLLTGLALNSNTGYLNLPIGTYTLVVEPTGSARTTASAPAYTGPQVTYSSGEARTLILIDQLPTPAPPPLPGIQVITAQDLDSPLASS
ncbi:MAG: DUF4397 domain-containing protein [Acidobacteriota bacterium]|nr:DUF4397 domain-containing protein [Acidobacteriota bacterium]